MMMMMMSSSQVKKETQQLREFEEVLLSQYKFYLEDLEQCIKGERRTRVVTSRDHVSPLVRFFPPPPVE